MHIKNRSSVTSGTEINKSPLHKLSMKSSSNSLAGGSGESPKSSSFSHMELGENAVLIRDAAKGIGMKSYYLDAQICLLETFLVLMSDRQND